MFTTIIIDDEKLARQRIRTLLAKDKQISIVAECDNGLDAVKQIQKLKPDFIFLDIQMPEKNGLQVLKDLEIEQLPLIVFVTAYDKYAVKAFDINALDYLLKPFDDTRFNTTIKRIKNAMQEAKHDLNIEKLNGLISALDTQTPPKRIAVKQTDTIHFLPYQEIICIKADGKYVELHNAQQQYKMRKQIRVLEQELDQNIFIRVHRSTIVNINHIVKMQHWYRGEYVLIMSNGDKIISGQAYKENLQRLL